MRNVVLYTPVARRLQGARSVLLDLVFTLINHQPRLAQSVESPLADPVAGGSRRRDTLFLILVE